MADNVLEVKHLRVEFPTRKGVLVAVDDVSFSIARGEILGLVGESGAGKSMTGAAVIGLLQSPGHVAAGEIIVDGQRIDGLTDAQMVDIRGKVIGAIFQDPLTSLDPLMSIGDQLVETIMRHLPLDNQSAKARAIELLEKTGIPAPLKRFSQFPHEFSGGMRQRVVIALALAANPKLIIADEPTTALDVSVQAQIIDLLKQLAKEFHSGVMLITHDMGVIAETADRVAVMYSGRIVEIGPVAEVLHDPKHPYTKGLMAAIPNMKEAGGYLHQIEGSMPGLANIPAGCAFHDRCQFKTPQCSKRRPCLVSTTANHQVACYLIEGCQEQSAGGKE
ncbi:MAG TPA: ABC transporter ATP-binding protein [Candidatus Aphodousia faecipullorum]|nr:ABC transporter ATP-binding protein [Candidatus Aphodousia faecipullorum]